MNTDKKKQVPTEADKVETPTPPQHMDPSVMPDKTNKNSKPASAQKRKRRSVK